MAEEERRREESFISWKVSDLKKFLKDHGQLQSGRKDELIRRAKGTFALLQQKRIENLCDSNCESDRVPHISTTEHAHVQQLKNWRDVDVVPLGNWPVFTDKELYDYLVYTCQKAVDLTQRRARRQLKASLFYEDGHVHSVKHHPVLQENGNPDDQCYVSGLVIPSAASSDKKLYPDRCVWIRMSTLTARVNSAYCTCTAGLEGSCNHVAALLYALVDITEHKQKGLDSSTSQACRWKQPRKRRLSPVKAHVLADRAQQQPPRKQHQLELSPKQMQEKEQHDSPQQSGQCQQQPKSAINLQRLAYSLSVCAPECGWYINYTAAKEDTSATASASETLQLPSLPSAQFLFADGVDLRTEFCRKTFKDFVDSYAVSCESIKLIEKLTVEQANSDTWFQARAGRLTSSYFGEVLKRRSTTAPEPLLRKIMQYESSFENAHTKWGKTHEAAARRIYINFMKKCHPHLTVRKAGLILDESMPYLASSPDGLVQCSHCQPTQGLLEIKCPSSIRHSTPAQACADKTFCCELVEGQVTLKRNHSYFYQIQGQMGVSGRKWCDLVIWTLKGFSIQRIRFDDCLWGGMEKTLKDFFTNQVVPEIFSERVKRGKKLF